MVGKDEKRKRIQIRKDVGNRPLSTEALKATGKIQNHSFQTISLLMPVSTAASHLNTPLRKRALTSAHSAILKS